MLGSTPRIRTPYTDLSPITESLLRGYEGWEKYHVGGTSWDYCEYMQDRWNDNATFINVEHDMIFWPGAIEELWDCPNDWCYCAYSSNEIDPQFAYLGFTKISSTLMERIPNVWIEFRDMGGLYPDKWMGLDEWLWRSLSFDACRHYPGVVNANPKYFNLVGNR